VLAETGMAVIRLPCSPKAHTGLIVLLGRRCSLKRAVGDELTTIFKKQQASLEGTFKRAIGDQSALIPRERNKQAWKEHVSHLEVDQPCPLYLYKGT
jgi:hypothetical protein